MAAYTIASQEGADHYGAEVGDNVDLDLNPDEERAVIAAGWLEVTKQAKEAN